VGDLAASVQSPSYGLSCVSVHCTGLKESKVPVAVGNENDASVGVVPWLARMGLIFSEHERAIRPVLSLCQSQGTEN
jgi:hypothetical protein